ncbi:MAG TPA: S9 family peptidase [Gemmataceae bacterium]|jgi:oligopeptidase B|nr:S9 family peptidase [Gemmataceae bacterium]
MLRRLGLIAPAVLLLNWAVLYADDKTSSLAPPVATKIPRATELHGDKIVDNYYWLREKKSEDVLNYLRAENAYTEMIAKRWNGLEDRLYHEIIGRIKQTDLSVPYQESGWWYYTRTEEGKQYPIHCRRKGSMESAEEVFLDGNELAKGKKFLGIGAMHVSDDGNFLAFATDETGFREFHLSIKDLRNGELLPDKVEKISSAAWAADNKTLFYVTDDHAKRPYRLYRHQLGNSKDELLYEEKDELYRLSVHRSHDRKFVFANSGSSLTSEARYLPSDQPQGDFRIVLPRENEHRYSVDHRDGLFYIRTNKGAKNFKIVTAPVQEPAKWTDFIAYRPDVMVEGITLFAKYAVVSEREQGLSQLAVHDFATGKSERITFPEPVYSVGPNTNPEFDTDLFRFNYTSLVTPQSVYEYNLATKERKLLKQTEVLGGYDPAKYQSERIFASAKDGVKIPISIVYRKDVKLDGKAPCLLGGYGSYGASVPATFQAPNLSLLDRGVVVAWAHIRGGGDMGQAWHDDGKMMHKKNTFTDFITCADYLVDQKYTAHERLAIRGGSAGGLLIGAVLNLRPDVCKAAVLNVPFVDVVNTMLDESLPLTVPEFLEWGNPKLKKEYDYIKTYCPYTNIAAKAYPAMLVTTSLNDSQVMYWEPAKYVAKMRAVRTDHNPLLFRITMAGGHGGSSGRYDRFKELAFDMAFILNRLDVQP